MKIYMLILLLLLLFSVNCYGITNILPITKINKSLDITNMELNFKNLYDNFQKKQFLLFTTSPTIADIPEKSFVLFKDPIGSLYLYTVSSATLYCIYIGSISQIDNADKLDLQHGLYYGIREDIRIGTSSLYTNHIDSMTEVERRNNLKLNASSGTIMCEIFKTSSSEIERRVNTKLEASSGTTMSEVFKSSSNEIERRINGKIDDTPDVITSTHLAHSISIATMLSGLNDIECADVFTSSGLAGIKANPTTNVSLTVGQATSGYESIKTQTTTTSSFVNLSNTGGYFYIGRTRSTGGDILSGSAAYAGVIAVGGVYPLSFGTDDTIRMTLSATGMVTVKDDLEVADVFYSSGTGDFQDNTKLKVNLAGQTIEGSSITVVKFGSLATGFADTLSEVVGDGFRVVKSGFYSICGMFDIQHDSDTIQSIYCYKNHVEVGQSRNLGPATFAYHQNKYADFMYLAAGDLLEFFTDSSTSMRKISSATDKSYVIIYRVP